MSHRFRIENFSDLVSLIHGKDLLVLTCLQAPVCNKSLVMIPMDFSHCWYYREVSMGFWSLLSTLNILDIDPTGQWFNHDLGFAFI